MLHYQPAPSQMGFCSEFLNLLHEANWLKHGNAVYTADAGIFIVRDQVNQG